MTLRRQATRRVAHDHVRPSATVRQVTCGIRCRRPRGWRALTGNERRVAVGRGVVLDTRAVIGGTRPVIGVSTIGEHQEALGRGFGGGVTVHRGYVTSRLKLTRAAQTADATGLEPGFRLTF